MTAQSPITKTVFTFQRCEIYQSYHEAPEVDVFFLINRQKSTTRLSGKDVLNYLKIAGKYAHEGFSVDMDGIYYVKEYHESETTQGIVKINLEAKINTLTSAQWGFILQEALKHTPPNFYHLFKI